MVRGEPMTDLVTDCAGSPINVRDIEFLVDQIWEGNQSITTAYAVSDKESLKAVNWSINPYKESPLRSMQFEVMGITFVVSDRIPGNEIRVYRDIYDDEPLAIIRNFSTYSVDYPR